MLLWINESEYVLSRLWVVSKCWSDEGFDLIGPERERPIEVSADRNGGIFSALDTDGDLDVDLKEDTNMYKGKINLIYSAVCLYFSLQ